ncbi:MAG: bifunctional UDP-sugar hydrolase/5'-nucleotidase [Muribaculaceae bacterium]|nr:bifunctional UDP-sugar hydrolase/5'-nucleotidase [Muribaculaceae bacterium]
MQKLILIALLVLSSVLVSAEDHLVIIHTNDTHSQIDPDYEGKGGILRRKTLIDSVRSHNENVLLIDAGDAVQGSLYYTLFGGKVEFSLMDSLKYDMQILGNHEFDNGIDSISTFYRKLKAVKLSSNYCLENSKLRNLFKEYEIKEYNGKKIAFLGINIDPNGIIQDYKYNGLVYRDAFVVADSLATLLKGNKMADYVVVISHIGYSNIDKNKVTDTELVKRSHNIDLVIGGHSHTSINPADSKSVAYKVRNADNKEILICQAGHHGRTVGIIDIDLDDFEAESKLLVIEKNFDYNVDNNLVNFIAPYKHVVDSLMNNPIAYAKQDLGIGSRVRIINWVGDVAMEIAPIIYKGKIDLSVMNKGGIRGSIKKGVVTEGEIGSLFPFDNAVWILKIKGSDLLEGFSVMARRGGDAVCKGVKIVYGKDYKIKSATLNGKEIKKNKYYVIATLDYLANGGDYMESFKRAEVLAKDDIRYGTRMLNYVREQGEKNIEIDSTDESRMYSIY